MNFRRKYPLSARETAYTPMIIRDGFGADSSLPYPSLNGIRDFARYCGIKDGAIRTALSRGKAEGDLQTFTDEKKTVRYRITGAMLEMGKTVTGRPNQPEGFIVAVFSFTADAVAERAKVRETLKYYGFKKLAQNTYVNGRIETGGLKDAMRKFGLEKNLYLFDCPDVDDVELMQKIRSVFEIEKRKKYLHGFYRDLAAFLTVENLEREEIVHRISYAGPVYWTICYVDEPPFPAKHLPEDYPLSTITRLYEKFSEKHRQSVIEHYLQVNG
jgi:DNA-binding transcriptional regulator PaaX